MVSWTGKLYRAQTATYRSWNPWWTFRQVFIRAVWTITDSIAFLDIANDHIWTSASELVVSAAPIFEGTGSTLTWRFYRDFRFRFSYRYFFFVFVRLFMIINRMVDDSVTRRWYRIRPFTYKRCFSNRIKRFIWARIVIIWIGRESSLFLQSMKESDMMWKRVLILVRRWMGLLAHTWVRVLDNAYWWSCKIKKNHEIYLLPHSPRPPYLNFETKESK